MRVLSVFVTFIAKVNYTLHRKGWGTVMAMMPQGPIRKRVNSLITDLISNITGMAVTSSRGKQYSEEIELVLTCRDAKIYVRFGEPRIQSLPGSPNHLVACTMKSIYKEEGSLCCLLSKPNQSLRCAWPPGHKCSRC